MRLFMIKIRCLTSQENGIAYIISHNFSRLKINSYDSVPSENPLLLHNVNSC